MTTPLDDPRFTSWPSGRFRAREGKLAEHAAYSSKKLCLVATDLKLLVDVLYGLSLREDCRSVKYGTVSRDGMYLGRCWLATDEAVSELCEALKGHPRLMVSLQDDAWFERFRAEPVPDDACGVWEDWPEHEAQVTAVLEAAFGRGDEAKLVAALRAAGLASISLVAGLKPERPARDPWQLVGHVLLSPVSLDPGISAPDPGDRRGLGLGPLAVEPTHQRRGFGACLVRAALRNARLLGYRYVVVLGAPRYYTRFGFVPASEFGLSYRGPGHDPHFMALELVPDALRGVSGIVRYAAAFDAVSL